MVLLLTLIHMVGGHPGGLQRSTCARKSAAQSRALFLPSMVYQCRRRRTTVGCVCHIPSPVCQSACVYLFIRACVRVCVCVRVHQGFSVLSASSNLPCWVASQYSFAPAGSGFGSALLPLGDMDGDGRVTCTASRLSCFAL